MDDHALRVLEFDAIRKQLAEHTACSLGRERAEEMKPGDYFPYVRSRLNETTECRKLITDRGSLPLGGINDIRPWLRQAEIGSTLDPRQLLDILSTAAAGRSLKLYIQKMATEYPIMSEKTAGIGQFPSLETEISNCIGLNGQILDTASPELARIRSSKKVTSARMMDKLNGIVTGSMRTMLQDAVIVQRGDRYCVPVKAEHRGAFGGIVHDTSASGATLFMEPQAVVDLGNALKELAIKEDQEIARILNRLTEAVRRVSTPLMVSVEILGEIDFISARAKLADQMNAVEPDLTQSGHTRLVAARHPLIDPNIVVPIDVEIGAEINKILLITGPNTGGKTVTLKTVGLLTLMVQCGLHVPAVQAEMNVFYQVFADIGDEQSLQQSLSTFSGHVSNIVKIVNNLRRNALVLLDEVGAGTDPGEGASLARAILEKLRAADARVIATTHYGELKAYAFVTEGVQNASVEFDMRTLAPTYRLLQGIPGSSNAFAIAGRLGMPNDILDEARHELTGSDATAELFRELEEGRRKALADARDAERARIETQMLKRKYQEELSNLEALRREARQKASEEARTLIRRAQERVENIIGELRKASHEGRQTERARQKIRDIGSDLQRAIERRTETEEPAEVEVVPSRPLRKGDRVRITTLGMTGEVLENQHDGDSATLPVQVGAMRVSVPPSSLRLIGENGQELATTASASSAKHGDTSGSPSLARRGSGGGSTSGGGQPAPRPVAAPPSRPKLADAPSELGGNVALQKTAEITSQITLLGQRVDEALQNVEKYIDDSYAAGLMHVRIVHGKGTGALRRAVQDFLRDNPLVASYATAHPDEGGAGATVVELRAT
jgi:DNA mismatch repair protein MutS2